MAAISYLLTLAQTVNASTGAILGQGLEAVVAGTSPPGDCIATVTAGSPVIAGANDYSVGMPMQFSGSLNKKVPMVCNIGRTDADEKESVAFPVDKGEPSYFIWD